MGPPLQQQRKRKNRRQERNQEKPVCAQGALLDGMRHHGVRVIWWSPPTSNEVNRESRPPLCSTLSVVGCAFCMLHRSFHSPPCSSTIFPCVFHASPFRPDRKRSPFSARTDRPSSRQATVVSRHHVAPIPPTRSAELSCDDDANSTWCPVSLGCFCRFQKAKSISFA